MFNKHWEKTQVKLESWCVCKCHKVLQDCTTGYLDEFKTAQCKHSWCKLMENTQETQMLNQKWYTLLLLCKTTNACIGDVSKWVTLILI